MTGPARDEARGSGSAWRAFRDAATRPSLAALLGTLLVAALCVVAMAWWLTPPRLARVDPGWMQIDPHDRHTVVTFRSYRIRESAPEPFGVVILGASDFLHALPSELEVSEEISRRVGVRVPVQILCAGQMRLWDMRALVDSIGARMGGALVIGSTPILFVSSRELLGAALHEGRFGFASDALQEEGRLVGIRSEPPTGIHLLDHHRFLAPRLGALLGRLLTGPAVPVLHRDDLRPLAERGPVERLTFARRAYNQFHGYDLDTAMLERLIEQRRAAGPVEIALVEMPWHPRLVAQIPDEEKARYRAVVQQVARDRGLHYWNLWGPAGIQPGDFGDAIHIARPETRRRFARELARRLAPLLLARVAQTG